MTLSLRPASRARKTAPAFLSAIAVMASGVAGISLFGPTEAQARITRIEIKRVEQPTFQGRSFGTVGAYEKLVGRAFGEVDPNDPRNALIVDIAHAPKNARGMVEYDMDFMILKPVDLAKGNHRLWFEVNNRGNLGAFQQYNDAHADEGNNPTAADDAGNGFVLRQGYTIATAGWDISAPPGDSRFTIRVPVAVNADGSPIVGPAMEEFVIDNDRTFAGRLSYAAASLDKSQATLTVRTRYEDEPAVVPADQWEFADKAGKAIRLVPDKTPFAQGTLYTFTYQAKNPLVAGLGFAALRDFNSFLRYAERDDAGTANPLAGDVKQIYTSCRSQPCRTLHDFVWLGFNEDEAAARSCRGIENWIGGSTGIFMNYRFAQPGRTHRQHIARWYPGIPGAVHQPGDARSDHRQDRWAVRALHRKQHLSQDFRDQFGERILVEEHGRGPRRHHRQGPHHRARQCAQLSHRQPAPFGRGRPTGSGICQQPRNPLVPNAVLRALLVDIDEWVSNGKEPPASRVPRVDDGTLVPPLPQEKSGFPTIHGVTYNGRMHDRRPVRLRPAFRQGIITILPPQASSARPTRCWCRRPMPTATISPASACPMSRFRSRPIPAGRCALILLEPMTAAMAPASKSPSPRPRRSVW